MVWIWNKVTMFIRKTLCFEGIYDVYKKDAMLLLFNQRTLNEFWLNFLIKLNVHLKRKGLILIKRRRQNNKKSMDLIPLPKGYGPCFFMQILLYKTESKTALILRIASFLILIPFSVPKSWIFTKASKASTALKSLINSSGTPSIFSL